MRRPHKAPQVSFNMSNGLLLPQLPMCPFIWLQMRTAKQNTSLGEWGLNNHMNSSVLKPQLGASNPVTRQFIYQMLQKNNVAYKIAALINHVVIFKGLDFNLLCVNDLRLCSALHLGGVKLFFCARNQSKNQFILTKLFCVKINTMNYERQVQTLQTTETNFECSSTIFSWLWFIPVILSQTNKEIEQPEVSALKLKSQDFARNCQSILIYMGLTV